MSERRTLKRKLGLIADALRDLDRAERRIREDRAALRREQDEITAQVYRS